MSYAVIKTGGKQYRVSVGDKVAVEKLEGAEGDVITFGEVLAAGAGDGLKFGAPFLSGANVAGKVVKQFKGEKVIAFKFKRRKGFAKKKGHRQNLTQVEITAINV